MKNIILTAANFLWEHREAILTFVGAIFVRGVEKPQTKKKTAKEIHDSLLEGKTMYETFKNHLKH